MKNPEGLTHALAHHAQPLEPLVGVLAVGFVTHLHAKGWEPVQRSTGPNSWSWSHPSGYEVHFRAYRPFSEIQVKDSSWNGREITRLRTRVDCLNFVRRLAALP
jgi:hypothetical protein